MAGNKKVVVKKDEETLRLNAKADSPVPVPDTIRELAEGRAGRIRANKTAHGLGYSAYGTEED